jgi:hypothetical protein
MTRFCITAGGDGVDFLTIGELGKLCERSKHQMYKYISQGTLPDANFRKPAKVITKGEKKGEKIAGERLFSKDFLAPRIQAIFKEAKIKRGFTVSVEVKQKFYEAFAEEKEYYLKTKK